MAKATTINISMPAALAGFVKARVEGGGYGNTSEYFRDLVRQDQKRAKEEALVALLEEGMTGPAEVVDEKWWAERRRKLASLSKGKRKKSA